MWFQAILKVNRAYLYLLERMDGMDIDGFIFSQRNRLAEEKSRLAAKDRCSVLNNAHHGVLLCSSILLRKPKSIIPSDSSALLKSNRLRRERQQEYSHYLEEVGNSQAGRHNPASNKSVAELRRNLSRERENELRRNEAKLSGAGGGSKRSSSDFTSLREKELSEERRYREKRLAEERRYSQGHFADHEQRHRDARDSGDRSNNSKVKFEKDRKGAKYSSWDEEEEDLMKWTRNQAYSTSSRAPATSHRKAHTPPAMDSPRINTENSKASLRSISAPNVAAAVAGIAALGATEDSNVKRMRQLKYAEELRNQMKEKKGGESHGNSRRRQEEKLERNSDYNPDTDRPRRAKYDFDRFDDGSGKYIIQYSSFYQVLKQDCIIIIPNFALTNVFFLAGDEQGRGHKGKRDGGDLRRHQNSSPYHSRRGVVSPAQPPRHHQYSDEEEEGRAYRKPKRTSDRHGGRYDYNQDPYGPPPPPPRFQGGGYNSWGGPYYPPYHHPPPHPPPHGAGYDTPYADLYFPPYAGNPYAPPPQGSRPPSQGYWANRGRSRDERGEGDLRATEEKQHNRSPRRQQSEKEPEVAVAPFLGIGANTAKPDKDTYRKELKKQMQEKKERDMKEKVAKEKYEQQTEEIYDPFGKGGCGAPVRDQFGNLVADLKQMRKINENRLSGNSPINLRLSKDSARENAATTPLDFADNVSPRNTILTYDKQDSEEVKKASQESYRDYLRRQVKEKEELKQREKEKQRIEEERELEQLERDRKRLQEEYQQELKRQRRREEEARSKNEAIKHEAELKRQMAIMQAQREEEERRGALTEKRFSENSNNFNLNDVQRPNSPPVPALRKMKQLSNPPPPHGGTQDSSEQGNFRSSSPPVPALRKKQARGQQDPAKPVESRPEQERQPAPEGATQRRDSGAVRTREMSATQDRQEASTTERSSAGLGVSSPTRGSISSEAEQRMLLTQLGAIRMHLQAELAKQTSQQHHQSSDIFEKAKQQKPKIAGPRLSRPRESATLNALGEFNKLKYGTSSQRGGRFYEDFPDAPDNESSLEVQQRALLNHQQEMLKKVERERGRVWGNPPALNSPMLSAQTAHLDANSRIALGDDESRLSIGGCSLDVAESAHSVRPQPMGRWKDGGRGVSPTGSRFSVSTQDVDGMAARNEERLQRLEAILNAGGRSREPSTLSENYLGPTLTRRDSRQSERSLECEVQHLPTT